MAIFQRSRKKVYQGFKVSGVNIRTGGLESVRGFDTVEEAAYHVSKIVSQPLAPKVKSSPVSPQTVINSINQYGSFCVQSLGVINYEIRPSLIANCDCCGRSKQAVCEREEIDKKGRTVYKYYCVDCEYKKMFRR